MKFYNLKTKHKQDYIDEIIKSLKPTESEYIISIYKQISIVEYVDDKEYECMYGILDDYQISKLDEIFERYGIKFEIADLTKQIIFDEEIEIDFKNSWDRSVTEDIKKLIIEFKSNWITKDDVLDKILEKGLQSLTKQDYKILNS